MIQNATTLPFLNMLNLSSTLFEKIVTLKKDLEKTSCKIMLSKIKISSKTLAANSFIWEDLIKLFPFLESIEIEGTDSLAP